MVLKPSIVLNNLFYYSSNDFILKLLQSIKTLNFFSRFSFSALCMATLYPHCSEMKHSQKRCPCSNHSNSSLGADLEGTSWYYSLLRFLFYSNISFTKQNILMQRYWVFYLFISVYGFILKFDFYSELQMKTTELFFYAFLQFARLCGQFIHTY